MFGFLIHGPYMHFNFKYLVPKVAVGAGAIDIAAKLAFMQTYCTLTVTIFFYLFMAILQREPLLGEARVKLLPTYKKHLKYMTSAVLLSLTLIPPDLKAPFMSSC